MHYRTCFSSEGCQKRSPPNVRRVHQPTWIRNCFYCTSVISYFKLFFSSGFLTNSKCWWVKEPDISKIWQAGPTSFVSIFFWSNTLNMFQSWITSFEVQLYWIQLFSVFKYVSCKARLHKGDKIFVIKCMFKSVRVSFFIFTKKCTKRKEKKTVKVVRLCNPRTHLIFISFREERNQVMVSK